MKGKLKESQKEQPTNKPTNKLRASEARVRTPGTKVERNGSPALVSVRRKAAVPEEKAIVETAKDEPNKGNHKQKEKVDKQLPITVKVPQSAEWNAVETTPTKAW